MMGPEDKDNSFLFHYSQMNSFDELISRKISKYLQAPLMYYPLDAADFVRDIEKNTFMNSGTAYYLGITGGARALELLSSPIAGIEFTGLLGNIYDGGFLSKGDAAECAPSLQQNYFRMTSDLDVSKINTEAFSWFGSNELFWVYTRGMMCGMSTFLTRQNFVEPYTPFGYSDFMNAWLTIPFKKKTEEKILLQWLQNKYPDAMKVMYSGTANKLQYELKNHNKYISYVHSVPNRILMKIIGIDSNMNPMELWEKQKPWIPEMIEHYYITVTSQMKDDSSISNNLLKSIEKVYKSPNVLGKYVALSVLASYRLFCADEFI